MPSVSSVLIHALVVEDNIRFGGLVYKLETVVGVGAPGASRGPSHTQIRRYSLVTTGMTMGLRLVVLKR